MSAPSGSKMRSDIQALRAIAVLAVVLYHVGVPGMSGGYIGVDAFFVISGFLITTHLFGGIRQGRRISFRDFYARRARRLLPMAAVVATAAVVGSWLWLDVFHARAASTDAIWTSIFALNFHLASDGVQYMGNTDPSALQHYWSLAVEEQFYVVWPLGLALLTWRWWRRPAGQRPTGTPWLAVAGVGVVIVVSYVWCINETNYAQSLAYFLTPARAWELAIGALIALTADRLVALPAALRTALTWGGLGAVVAAAVLLSDATRFPGWIAMWPVLGCAAVIIGGLPGTSSADRVLGIRPVQWFGDISYSWYLWHWPVLILLPAAVGHSLSWLELVGAVLLSLWLAAGSHVVLEDPLRYLPSIRDPLKSVGVAGGFSGLVFAAILIGPHIAPPPQGPGPAAEPAATATATQLAAAIARAAKTTAVPANLTPKVTALAADQPKINWADGKTCMVDLATTVAVGSCRTTAVGTKTVVVAGDSHAFQWMPALEKIAVQRHWTLYDITKSGCPLYDTTIYSTDYKRNYTECNTWRGNAMKRIVAMHPDMVVTSGFVASTRGKTYADDWLNGVHSTITRLKATGATVVAIMDTPWTNEEVPSCIATNSGALNKCAVPRVQPWRDSARENGTPSAARSAGAIVIDPTNWFCTSSTCPVVIGNAPIYHDQTHMSATWAASLTTLLAARLPTLHSS